MTELTQLLKGHAMTRVGATVGFQVAKVMAEEEIVLVFVKESKRGLRVEALH